MREHLGVAQHGGVLEVLGVAGRDRRAVQGRAAARRGRVGLVQGGAWTTPAIGRPSSTTAIETANHGLPFMKATRAVDRVDHELAGGGQASGIVDRLLRQPAIAGPRAAQAVFQQGVDGQVGVGDRRAAVLGPDLQAAGAGLQRPARQPRAPRRSGSGPGRSFAGDRQGVDQQGGAVVRARGTPGPSRGPAGVDVDQVAGHGDLGDRAGDLAVLEPEGPSSPPTSRRCCRSARGRTSR
jgi:hypothetical protein